MGKEGNGACRGRVQNTAFARQLRKNPTPQEALLWPRIRRKQIEGFEFHRQVPLHKYIVDFYCHELGLAIEIDGSIHDYQVGEDMIRQSELESFGIVFIRFLNDEVEQDLDGVVERIRGLVADLVG